MVQGHKKKHDAGHIHGENLVFLLSINTLKGGFTKAEIQMITSTIDLRD
jgi:hypothetical protein